MHLPVLFPVDQQGKEATANKQYTVCLALSKSSSLSSTFIGSSKEEVLTSEEST